MITWKTPIRVRTICSLRSCRQPEDRVDCDIGLVLTSPHYLAFIHSPFAADRCIFVHQSCAIRLVCVGKTLREIIITTGEREISFSYFFSDLLPLSLAWKWYGETGKELVTFCHRFPLEHGFRRSQTFQTLICWRLPDVERKMHLGFSLTNLINNEWSRQDDQRTMRNLAKLPDGETHFAFWGFCFGMIVDKLNLDSPTVIWSVVPKRIPSRRSNLKVSGLKSHAVN